MLKQEKNPCSYIKTGKSTFQNYDLIVIGSGPAGIHAAVQAAKLNKKVCIIEKMPKHVGGSWIHTGTLPSKTLRESLATIHSIRNHVGESWVARVINDLHSGKLFDRAHKVSMQEENLVRSHLENNSIHLLEGYGTLENRFSVRVLPPDDEPFTVSGDVILISTGSRPRRPPNVPFDGWRVVDSDELLTLESVPKSMVIYGAGVVGCEYACIFSALGVTTTVVDSRPRILPYLDTEIGEELQKSMESIGVRFELGKPLTSIRVDGPRVLTVAGDKTLASELLFYAAGRISCTDRIGLERLGIKRNDRGSIVVNENFQTCVSNIYAAGDAIGPPALAATSSQQGRHVACHAFGVNIGCFPEDFPVGVYTIPELSMVGKTEDALVREGLVEGRDFIIGRSHYYEIARGYIRGDSHGLLKIIVCASTHKILGIHIVGADACNLIHIGLAIKTYGGRVQDILKLVFNYPTLAEGFRIAAFNALNKMFPDGFIKPPPEELGAGPGLEGAAAKKAANA